MDPTFAAFAERLHPAFERLIGSSPVVIRQFPIKGKIGGIYLLSEGGRHLYVGRSNNIRGRYGRHCNPGASHRMAAFAFRLARETTGRLMPSYKAGPDSRTGLMADTAFREAFDSAKARIRMMEFRYVVEDEPVSQALLEVYTAVVLGTPYNDFDNH